MPTIPMIELIPLLVHCTILFAVVLVAHRMCSQKSAAFRHGVLSLGLLVLPISIAMQCVEPMLTLPVPCHWAASESVDQTNEAPRQPTTQSMLALSRNESLSESPVTAIPELAFDSETPVSESKTDERQSVSNTYLMRNREADGIDSAATLLSVPAASETAFQPQNASRANLPNHRDGFSATLTQALLTIWLLGTLALLFRIAMSWWLARVRIKQAFPIDSSLQNRLVQLAPRLRNGKIRVRTADRSGQMPICIGFLKPTIVLPQEIDQWSEGQLKAVLNHELAHAVRGDAWTNLLAHVQTALLWFHPLSFLLNKRRRRECEIACDDWAIEQGLPQRDYARALLDVASHFRARDLTLSHPMAARSSALDRRIKSILASTGTRSPLTQRQKISFVGIFVMFSVVVTSIWVEATEAQQAITSEISQDNFAKPDDAETAAVVTTVKAVSVPDNAITDDTVVKAVNLGNWLLMEPWLLDITEEGFPDQSSIFAVLNNRFGEEKAQKLLTTYRENWITLSDLQAARSLGFNAVRLPFDCGLLEDADNPHVLRGDAFRWLDHAVDLCQQAGLSVILDLHGAPGGQSLDGPSGDASSNRLWTDPDARDRTVWLWKRIAGHYADHASVVAYDVVNEPYGDFGQDLRESMLDLFSQLYDSIREVDSKTLIYAPATLDGFAFYGNPADKGWEHVGFTQHAYPGLFDGRPAAVRSHDMFLKHWVEPVDRMVDELKVPFLLGEYNVVFEDAGGAALTAWYAQEYERRGWSTAVWTLKRLLRTPSPDVNSWSLLTNTSGVTINLRTDSFEKLNAVFEEIGDIPWRADKKFSQTLRGESKIWKWPGSDPWHSAEIETDVPGSCIIRGGNWVLQGAGRDIFGRRDRFHFKSRHVEGDFEATGRVLWIDETSPWAKAGWMIRANESADAPHLLLHTTPDGKVIICGRDAKGEDSWQKTVGVGGLPVRLGIKRQGDRIHFAWTDAGGQPMKKTFSPSFLADNDQAIVGMAVCSLAPGIRTTVGLDNVKFKTLRSDGSAANFDAWQTKQVTLVSNPQSDASTPSGNAVDPSVWSAVALENPSFEKKGESDDLAVGWNRWGNWVNREADWVPVRDGSAIIGYHHFRIESDTDSGLWQNAKVQANRPTRFRIQANADAGSKGVFAKSVELRLEVPGQDGTPVTVASKTFSADQIATGDQWSTLEVVGSPGAGVVRMIVCVVPAPGESVQRDGSIKFDSVELHQQSGNSLADSARPVTKTITGPSLTNGSFEQTDGNNGMPGWSQWGTGFARQNAWTPVRDGKAILAYEHYRTSGDDSSGVWQDIAVTQGAKVKFSVHANVDVGKPGTQPPRRVELKLESPMPDGKTITLAKKTFEAGDLAKNDAWSLLKVEATALGDKVRCLVIVEPNLEDGQRDGALKFDQASITVMLE